MGLNKKFLKIAALGFVLGAGVFVYGYAQEANAAKGDLVSLHAAKKTPPPLQITQGKADIIKLPGNVSDVLVADPDIIDVQAVQSDKLYIVGLSTGDTNIIVLDAQGEVLKKIDIHVTYDTQTLQSMLESLFPNESVKVGSMQGQILLTGTVSNPDTASKIANITGHYVSELQDTDDKEVDQLISNLMEVRGEQQVMLQVKIVEAKRSVLKELGLETAVNDPNELATTTIFGNTPSASTINNGNAFNLGAGPGLTLSEDAVGAAGLLLDTDRSAFGTIGLFLEALEQENLVNVLAEPNLTAVSGQQAGFLAGGEFPVPTGRDQFGNITIEFREFGVSLNFRPIVLSDKRINLQMNTEVSSLDTTNAVVLADLTVPGLDIRRAETTVELPSGGSLMIAGLLQSEATEGMRGLPGISDTPVLGDLIKSNSFRRDETELVVIVTSYLVESFADKEVAEKEKKKENSSMAKIFAVNIRKMFGAQDEELFAASSGPYGYLLD